ncbi:hypothetical protein HDU97_001037 [Phlyctochytrium planicorne]|nr:hypothetical protein HDU97_001037 [Phlyctochytrium planicorne]
MRQSFDIGKAKSGVERTLKLNLLFLEILAFYLVYIYIMSIDTGFMYIYYDSGYGWYRYIKPSNGSSYPEQLQQNYIILAMVFTTQTFTILGFLSTLYIYAFRKTVTAKIFYTSAVIMAICAVFSLVVMSLRTNFTQWSNETNDGAGAVTATSQKIGCTVHFVAFLLDAIAVTVLCWMARKSWKGDEDADPGNVYAFSKVSKDLKSMVSNVVGGSLQEKLKNKQSGPGRWQPGFPFGAMKTIPLESATLDAPGIFMRTDGYQTQEPLTSIPTTPYVQPMQSPYTQPLQSPLQSPDMRQQVEPRPPEDPFISNVPEKIREEMRSTLFPSVGTSDAMQSALFPSGDQQGAAEEKGIKTWDPETVSRVLTERGLEKRVAMMLQARNVHGRQLLQLDHEWLISLGFDSYHDRAAILKVIVGLEDYENLAAPAVGSTASGAVAASMASPPEYRRKFWGSRIRHGEATLSETQKPKNSEMTKLLETTIMQPNTEWQTHIPQQQQHQQPPLLQARINPFTALHGATAFLPDSSGSKRTFNLNWRVSYIGYLSIKRKPISNWNLILNFVVSLLATVVSRIVLGMYYVASLPSPLFRDFQYQPTTLSEIRSVIIQAQAFTLFLISTCINFVLIFNLKRKTKLQVFDVGKAKTGAERTLKLNLFFVLAIVFTTQTFTILGFLSTLYIYAFRKAATPTPFYISSTIMTLCAIFSLGIMGLRVGHINQVHGLSPTKLFFPVASQRIGCAVHGVAFVLDTIAAAVLCWMARNWESRDNGGAGNVYVFSRVASDAKKLVLKAIGGAMQDQLSKKQNGGVGGWHPGFPIRSIPLEGLIVDQGGTGGFIQSHGQHAIATQTTQGRQMHQQTDPLPRAEPSKEIREELNL